MIDAEKVLSGAVLEPESFWPVDDGYLERYREKIDLGRQASPRLHLAVVSIARTSLPHLAKTVRLLDRLAAGWRKFSWYVYENDSADGTAAYLDAAAATRPWMIVEHDTLGEPDERGFQEGRTHRLARARTRCQDRAPASADYVMVLDTDPHGGWSVDGVYNSLGWILDKLTSPLASRMPGAMASYSLFCVKDGAGGLGIAQYDAYAARLNHWEDRRQTAWFHTLTPPVGSPPIPMYSAFGGLCLYTASAFRSLRYAGGDCEHVIAHRAMADAGYQLWLNPGSRYVAILP